ncbi:unnamed protein product, partial [Brassica rapa subsp. trilocularis]
GRQTRARQCEHKIGISGGEEDHPRSAQYSLFQICETENKAARATDPRLHPRSSLRTSLHFIARLFSVLRYESMIHEFDPYFNYRTTLFLTEKGFYEFDSESWYPLVPPLYPEAGLVDAALIAICPGYISRSVAGSYDNEAVAIFALLLTFYLFVKAVNTGSLSWALGSVFGYF